MHVLSRLVGRPMGLLLALAVALAATLLAALMLVGGTPTSSSALEPGELEGCKRKTTAGGTVYWDCG